VCFDVQFGVWVDVACLCQHRGYDNSKVSSDRVVGTPLTSFVTAEGMVAKDIVVMASACAACVWWINGEA
jgi:hypothetical protein